MARRGYHVLLTIPLYLHFPAMKFQNSDAVCWYGIHTLEHIAISDCISFRYWARDRIIRRTTMTDLATPHAELRASLEAHNATFTKLLSLIPARFYLPPDQDELDSRWMKNKKRRTGEEIKEHKRNAKASKVSRMTNHRSVG